MTTLHTPNSTLSLRDKIDTRTARIGIVGLGYVGLPTAMAFASEGFSVTGIDLDPAKRDGVNAGRSHIEDVDAGAVAAFVSSDRLRAVGTVAEAGDLDVIDICVPTPLGEGRDPDLSALLAAVEALRQSIRPGQLIVLTSTTYPGTTVELIQPALESGDLMVGRDIFLAFAPERISPGDTHWGMRNTPKVVGGATSACTEMAARLFGTIVDVVVPVSSPTAAELVKLLENTFRGVNIALANEMAMICRRLGVDVWEVIDGAATKPYGFMPFYPGPGLGGHCIPVDPSYLSWKLRHLNYTARFVDLSNDINRHMPEYVVERATELLNDRGMSVRNARVLLLGLAYKPNVGDLRESPALDVLSLLHSRGAEVVVADPHVGSVTVDAGRTLMSIPITAELISAQDLVIVTTDHQSFPWDLIARHASLVLDTRGHHRGADRRARGWHSL